MANIPALVAFLEAQFGGRFTPQTKELTLGTSSQLALGHDDERMSVAFINLSGNNIYLAPDRDVSSSKGIELIGSGANLSLIARDDGPLVGVDWYGVASAASSKLYMIYTRRYSNPAAG